jgi:hypothetical protein
MAVSWVVTPYSLVQVYQRFRGPCCLRHQGDDGDQKTAIFVLVAVFTHPTNLTSIPQQIQFRFHNFKICEGYVTGMVKFAKCFHINKDDTTNYVDIVSQSFAEKASAT